MQAGVDALQIFDSWHSLCPKEKAWDWSLKWIKEIVENLSDPCPVLLYAKSSKERLKTLCQSGVSGLSLDHGIHLRDARMLPLPFCPARKHGSCHHGDEPGTRSSRNDANPRFDAGGFQ